MKPNALVVDDSAVIRSIMIKGVESAGATCAAEVADGPQLLDALHNGEFDIALLDATIPGIGLLGALYTILSQPHRPAVIVVGAPADHELLKDAQGAGADAVLMKPFSPAQLARKVQEVLERSPAHAAVV